MNTRPYVGRRLQIYGFISVLPLLVLACRPAIVDEPLELTESAKGAPGTPPARVLAPPSALELVHPASSLANVTQPRIPVSGVSAGLEVAIFTSADCSLGSLNQAATASGDSVEIQLEPLADGQYIFFARSAVSAEGVVSNCSSVSLSYEVDTQIPTLTGLVDDPVTKNSKSWAWGCGESNCLYRFAVDQNPTGTPAGEYGATATVTQSSGTGAYYLHVQAKDPAGNESAVIHAAAILDNAAPAVPNPVTLVSPASAVGNVTTPTIRVGGVTSGDTIQLYSDSQCESLLISSQASAAQVDFTLTSGLSDGSHQFYAKAVDGVGNASNCSSSSASYELDTTAPSMTGLANDATPRTSKTWSWGCNEANCTYRYTIDTAAATAPAGAYGTSTSASQASGSGTYYLHAQAKDAAGNESAVVHVSAILDNSAPTILSVSPPIDRYYAAGEELVFKVNFSEAVIVSGNPRLTLTIGATTRYAAYASGSGTAQVEFKYLLDGADSDQDGIVLANTVGLNGGTIADGTGNAANLGFVAPNLANVRVGAPTFLMCSTQTLNLTSNIGVLYDSGGAAGLYGNGQECVVNFDIPSGISVQLQVVSFVSENNYDYLKIFNGSGVELAHLTGTPAMPRNFTIEGNKLKITFHSDGSVTRDGFQIKWSTAVVTDDGVPPEAASALSWAQTSPSDSLLLTAQWTKSSSADLVNQKLQFYSDDHCGTTMGGLIDLVSQSTQSSDFTGFAGNTYTFRVMSLDYFGQSSFSECSPSVAISPTALPGGVTIIDNHDGTYTYINQPGPNEGNDADVHEASPTLDHSEDGRLDAANEKYAGNVSRALLGFSLAGIPANATITNAKVSVYYFLHNASVKQAETVVMNSLQSSFNEDTLRWGNQPAFNSTVLGSIVINDTAGDTYGWRSFGDGNADMRSYVSNQYSGGQSLGFVIRFTPALTYWRDFIVYSSEHTDAALRPKLEIRYTLP